MKRVYFSLSTHRQPCPSILIHLISPLNRDAVDVIYDEITSNRNRNTSPAFPWDTATLIIFYHGMEEMDRCFALQLPDGRKGTVINLNPGPDNDLPEFLREYARVIEVLKASLLSGNSCLKAAFAAWMAAQESAALRHCKLPLEHMIDDAKVWKELFEEYGFPKS